jgi:putative ABC transport system permease protein
VIGTLGLGLGSSTAIYAIMDGLMLRPIPFREPERLVSVSGGGGSPNLDREAASTWKAIADVFEVARAHSGRSFILTGAGEARSYRAELVEPGFLEMLGVRPWLGRDFGPEEALPGRERVLLLTHEVWGDAFGRDPDVLGRSVELDGEPYRVVGVLPPTVRRSPGGVVHLVAPLTDPPPVARVSLLGRLRPGVTLDAANARLAEVSARLSAERPREQGWEVGLRPLQRTLGANVANGFWTLGAAVLCLLLIACVNAAGLLFLRGVLRRQEFSLRLALGSSRAALARLVFAESALLALAAGALGTLVAWSAVRGLTWLLPSSLVRFSYTSVGLDGRVLAFASALTLATGFLFGVLPALRTTGATAARAGRSSTASRAEVRVRGVLQVGQIALAVLLVSGAGLFGRSFLKLLSVPLGYEVDEILELQLVSLERLRGDPVGAEAFAQGLDSRLRALPGVTSVARHAGVGFYADYTIELDDGRVVPSGAELLPWVEVDTAYFHTMGIPVVDGRPFEASDVEAEDSRVIVERDLAARLWPEGSAVGRRFRVRDEPWRTVVGVTGDVKLEGPLAPLGELLVFVPADAGELRSGVVVVRAAGAPASLVPAVRALVRELDTGQPIASVQTGRQALGESVADPRFLLSIMTLFAAVAVTLAGVGVYGLVSFTVAQRTREIGVRMALGARARRVVAGVFGWGLLLGSAGALIGLAAAMLLARFVEALLFGVSPLDPVALITAAGTLVGACALALTLPAWRAAAVQPVEALRVE